MKFFFYIILLVTMGACGPDRARNDRIKVYNDVLGDLIRQNYYWNCIGNTGEELYEDLAGRKIDSATYLKRKDSLEDLRKRTLPKCVLDYSNTLRMFSKNHHELDASAILALREALQDDLLMEYFPTALAGGIIDTLSKSAQLDAGQLSVSYLDIVPHVKKKYRPYGSGMGLIGFSGIFFNKQSDKAILFYEFKCGPHFNESGNILFVTRNGFEWKILKSKLVWIS